MKWGGGIVLGPSGTSNFLLASKLSLVLVRKYCVIAFKVGCDYRLKALSWLLFLTQGVSVRHSKKCGYVLSCWKLKCVEGLLMGTCFQRGAVCSLPLACSAGTRWAIETWKALCGLWWSPQLTQGSSSQGNWSSEFAEIEKTRETESLLDFFLCWHEKIQPFQFFEPKTLHPKYPQTGIWLQWWKHEEKTVEY